MFIYAKDNQVYSVEDGDSTLILTSENGPIKSLYYEFRQLYRPGTFTLGVVAITTDGSVYILHDINRKHSRKIKVDVIAPRAYEPLLVSIISPITTNIIYEHAIMSIDRRGVIIADTFCEDITHRTGSVITRVIPEILGGNCVIKIDDDLYQIMPSEISPTDVDEDVNKLFNMFRLMNNGDLYLLSIDETWELIMSNVIKASPFGRYGAYALSEGVLYSIRQYGGKKQRAQDVSNFHVSDLDIVYYMSNSVLYQYHNNTTIELDTPNNILFPVSSSYDLEQRVTISNVKKAIR